MNRMQTPQASSGNDTLKEVLNRKIAEIQTLQKEAHNVSDHHAQDIASLTQKFQEELNVLEHRFIHAHEPKSLIGKLWDYLNRTVVVISFRKTRRV